VPARLALAGDGDEREELEALAVSAGVADRVDFLGFVEDIPGLLAALDVYVTASRTEGLSMALLEAMASSTAVISTDIEPNAEVVEHGETGLLVGVGDPLQLAGAIAELAADPNRRAELGSAGADHVAERYSMERMFTETWQLYCDLLDGRTAAANDRMVIA
jgi:glycosyltransferase involved in cell wall biosynthesis